MSDENRLLLTGCCVFCHPTLARHRFAELRLASMDKDAMTQFETLLNQFDPDMNKWLMGKEEIPGKREFGLHAHVQLNTWPIDELNNDVWKDIVKFIHQVSV